MKESIDANSALRPWRSYPQISARSGAFPLSLSEGIAQAVAPTRSPLDQAEESNVGEGDTWAHDTLCRRIPYGIRFTLAR
jgi:hypothetical protein